MRKTQSTILTGSDCLGVLVDEDCEKGWNPAKSLHMFSGPGECPGEAGTAALSLCVLLMSEADTKPILPST